MLDQCTPGSLACGVLRPAARWSNSTARWRRRSKSRRAPGVQARTLYQQLAKRSKDVAVIAWLGYDAPDGIGLAAATEGRARKGAAALEAFVRDLRRQIRAENGVHDGPDVDTCAIQVREIRVLLVEYKGEIGAGQNDGIQVFALDDSMGERS